MHDTEALSTCRFCRCCCVMARHPRPQRPPFSKVTAALFRCQMWERKWNVASSFIQGDSFEDDHHLACCLPMQGQTTVADDNQDKHCRPPRMYSQAWQYRSKPHPSLTLQLDRLRFSC